jgi:hypothetical protein
LDHYFQLARFLQPAMIVIEDIDLIARKREEMYGPFDESLSINFSMKWTVFAKMRPFCSCLPRIASMKALSVVQLTNDGHAKEGLLRADGTRIYATEYVTELRNALVQISIKGRDLTHSPLHFGSREWPIFRRMEPNSYC